MSASAVKELGTPEKPWRLETPPGSSAVLEALGLAEVEHNPKNNRMRAVAKR